MQAANLEPQASAPSSSPTCAYWRSLAIDTLLELAPAREELARHDEDLVELVTAKRYEFYKAIGGTSLTEGAFKAKTRHAIRTGEWI